MMKWFDYSGEKALASKLASELMGRIKPKLLKDGQQMLSAKKISRYLENSYQEAKDYRDEHRLGAIRIAILANNFKWELKNLGYPEDFIHVATEGLVVSLRK